MAERPIQKELAKGAGDEVTTAHDFRDLHRTIIHRTRELIARQIVAPPHEKISEIHARDRRLSRTRAIAKLHPLARRHAKSPAHTSTRSRGNHPWRCPTRPRVNSFIVPGVRSAQSACEIFARTSARIDRTRCAELLKSRDIQRHPRALRIWSVRPGHVRPFAPLKAKPTQIFIHRRHVLRFATRTVEIVIAQDQRPAGRAASLLRAPKGARVPEMQKSRGGGGKATAVHGRLQSLAQGALASLRYCQPLLLASEFFAAPCCAQTSLPS